MLRGKLNISNFKEITANEGPDKSKNANHEFRF